MYVGFFQYGLISAELNVNYKCLWPLYHDHRRIDGIQIIKKIIEQVAKVGTHFGLIS